MSRARRFGLRGEGSDPEFSSTASESEATPTPVQPAGTERSPGGARSRDAVLELTRKIEDILETAERSAAEIQQEAEEAAAAYLEERRRAADRELEQRRKDFDRELENRVMSTAQLIVSLRREAEATAEHTRELARLAEEALAELKDHAAEPVPPRPQIVPSPAPTAPETGPSPESQPAPEEALLRAAQLAVGGAPGPEIERVLRAEFGIAQPAAIVAEILSGRDAGA